MRAIALATLVVLALAGAGCGGDAADAQDTVTAAISGLAQGKERQACEQLTAGAQRKLLATLADNPLNFPDIHATTCEEAVGKLYAKLSKPARAVLYDGEVADAKVTGDTAVVHVVGAGMDVELRKIDGSWKITGGLFR